MFGEIRDHSAVTNRDTSNDDHPTRRTAVKVALGLAGLAGLSSIGLCMRQGGESVSFDSLPFDVWRAIRDALRNSPDHLIARSEKLVVEGDVLALYHFVRDEIVTYPSGKRDYRGDNTRSIRWGAAATLRGGAGTPREKADLLASLLARAGHSADVVSVADTRTTEITKKQLAHVSEAACELGVSESEVGHWQDALGLSEVRANVVDRGGVESSELSRKLLELLPREADKRWNRARPFSEEWRPKYASVRVKTAEGTQILTPLVGESARGTDSLHVKPASESIGLLQVQVTLQAATMAAPNKRFDLVQQTWGADKLVGKQLFIQMLPACQLESWVMTRFSDVPAFIPILTLQDPQGASEPNQVSVGGAISREGERIVVKPDGTISIGENSISPLRSNKASEVRTLQIAVSSAAFPRIDLKVNALDKSGKRIEGLIAGDFSIQEDGKAVAHLLTANRASPRIAVLVDRSGSMPSEYAGTKMEKYFSKLESAMVTENSNAILLRRPTDSSLWQNLAKAAVDDPAFIVYITDGDVSDKSTKEILEKLSLGPKAVMIGVHHEKAEKLEAMAKATSGKVVFAQDMEESIQAIVEMLREHDEPSYRLRYSAPHREVGKHVVRLSVPKSRAEKSADYILSTMSPTGPPQLAGLYLRVKVGNQYEHTTTLAGHSHQYAKEEITSEVLSELRAALFGTHILGFEAAAPASSIWLDDLISARLSIEATRQAVERGDGGGAREALHSGFRFVPADLCQSMAALPVRQDTEALVYQLGLRITLFQEQMVTGGSTVRRRIRNLPTTMVAAADTDTARGCDLVARKTARIATVAQHRFDTDVAAQLEGKTLGALEFGSPAFKKLSSELRDRWREQMRGVAASHWIVSAVDAQTLSFYRISKSSGEIISVLADGWSARSDSPGHHVMDELMTLPNHLSARSAHAGIAVTLSNISNLGELLEGHAPAVNMVTRTLDAAMIDVIPFDHFACTTTRTILDGSVSIADLNHETLAPILAILSAPNAFSCPNSKK